MNIGFLGTGLMGQPMVRRLLSAQLPVIVYNRTRSKLESLQSAGAIVAASGVEMIEQSDCIILMLQDAQAIAETLLSDHAKLKLRNRTIIQMGTISPTQSRALLAEIVALGGEYLEAPVLGSIPEATSGKLMVMVGADPVQFQKWSSLLQNFGPEPRLIGPVGLAASVKLALNQLISSLTTAFALSLSFVEQQGLEVDTFMQILRQSALYAPTFDKKLPRMIQRDYNNPNFPTKHLLKDTNLFLAEANSNGLNTNSLEGVRQILEITNELGFSDADYAALYSAIYPQ